MDRVLSNKEFTNEGEYQKNLRPRNFKEYIGQDKLKEKMSIFIEAAKLRKESVDHILLYGPPGLGKTTLAGVIANEMGTNLKITSGPVLEKSGDLAAILTSLEENDILFIDEIHRLNTSVEEILYPAMEDGELDIIIGKGPSARSIRIELPSFTLIGATTRAGLLSAPLRDRFGVSHRMDYYTIENLMDIVLRGAEILGAKTENDGAFEIAKRSRGTPRIANALLRRTRDFAQSKNKKTVNANVVNDTMKLLGIDDMGLENIDREILRVIYFNFDGGPVGVSTLAASISEEVSTLLDVHEPYLMKCGLMKRTSRGRVLTSKGIKYVESIWQ